MGNCNNDKSNLEPEIIGIPEACRTDLKNTKLGKLLKHGGASSCGLYSHPQEDRSQASEKVHKWMTSVSGSCRQQQSTPRGTAFRAAIAIRSSMVSQRDQANSSYIQPDTPKGAAAASALTLSTSTAVPLLHHHHQG